MTPVNLSPSAVADIDKIISILKSTSVASAIRLLDGIDKLIDLLGVRPEIGMHVRVERPELPTVRWIRVPGYESYLAIYRLEDGRIEIDRVVHGSMNWLATLTSS